MTKRDAATAHRKLSGVEETLTFIRTQYTAAEQVKADAMVMDLEGQRAYLHGLLGLVRQGG